MIKQWTPYFPWSLWNKYRIDLLKIVPMRRKKQTQFTLIIQIIIGLFMSSSDQVLSGSWHKLYTIVILNPSEERCPYHLCIFLSRWTLYHLLWGKGVKKENFTSDELLIFPGWETIATSRFWMKNGIEPILSLKM